VDTSLPFPPTTNDYTDGSWTNWLDTSQLIESTYFMSIADIFRKHTQVTLVRLLRLAPGSVVKEHKDPTLGLETYKSVIRRTIPILTNNEVTFFLNQVSVPMQPGECWYLNRTTPHKIENLGKTERVNLTIDMIPNKWVHEMIKDSKSKQDT
jgi:hypothetical protein